MGRGARQSARYSWKTFLLISIGSEVCIPFFVCWLTYYFGGVGFGGNRAGHVVAAEAESFSVC